MGGLGSTRWGRHRKKRTVEGCRHFTVKCLLAGESPTPGRYGTLTWEGGASIGFVITPGPRVRLVYTAATATDDSQLLDYAVPLVAGKVPNGGTKYWFACPLAVDGKPCGRRCKTLYLPPGATYFGCRTCHRLVYRSSQAHDSRVSRLVKDPTALLAMIRDPPGPSLARLGLLLSALTELRELADRAANTLN